MFTVTTMDGWQELVVIPMLTEEDGSATVPANLGVSLSVFASAKRNVRCTRVLHVHHVLSVQSDRHVLCNINKFPDGLLLRLLHGRRCLDDAAWCQPDSLPVCAPETFAVALTVNYWFC